MPILFSIVVGILIIANNAGGEAGEKGRRKGNLKQWGGERKGYKEGERGKERRKKLKSSRLEDKRYNCLNR